MSEAATDLKPAVTLVPAVTFLDGKVTLRGGDCRDVIKTYPDNYFDSIVTDPPYALVSIVKRFGGANAKPAKGNDAYMRASSGFMNKSWDSGETAFSEEFWAEVYRVLKPGGHIAAFSGTRTYHRMAVAIEDAGFEIRDQLGYLYGSGFPKSHNVSHKLDGIRCSCAGCEAAEQVLQHNVRPVRDAHVQETERLGEECGEVLQSSMQEQGASTAGRKQYAGNVRSRQSSMEGRGDAKAAARELCVGPVREVSAPSIVNGETGRVRNGAPSGDGGLGGAPANTNGGCAPCGSQAVEQREDQSGIVAGQSQSQNGGAWPNCGRCGKSIIPDGIGTALKPAWEPICLARKPLIGTVAANVLEWGTGALNIDGCRVGTSDSLGGGMVSKGRPKAGEGWDRPWMHDPLVTEAKKEESAAKVARAESLGRWPANIVHDGSDEVVAAFPTAPGQQRAVAGTETRKNEVFGKMGDPYAFAPRNDSGSAARFFYSAKADKLDRIGSKHPTVKPVDLMQWLCRLVTPPGGRILDPFAGSGSTGEAAWREGFDCTLIEREPEYQADIAERLRLADKGPMQRKARAIKQTADHGPLFAANDNSLLAASA